MSSTFAPDNLLRVRRLFLDHLDFHQGTTAHSNDLDPAEAGIVPDSRHRGGYHCGRDRVDPLRDYSVVESTSRDMSCLSYAASAVDWGFWQTVIRGKTHNLRTYSVWLVDQCKRDTPDSRHIREVIYSPDGKVVKRWDRLGRRTTGDSSHLWHTHESHFRDSEKSHKLPLYVRYLREIGAITMELSDKLVGDTGRPGRTVDNALVDLLNLRNYMYSRPGQVGLVNPPNPDSVAGQMLSGAQALKGIEAKIDALLSAIPGAPIVTDEQLERVLRKVLGSLDSAV